VKMLKSIGSAIDRGITAASKYANIIGVASIAIIALIVSVNAFFRYLLKRPFTGTIEIAVSAQILAAFLALAYTAFAKSHVEVEVLTTKFSKKGRAIAGIFTRLMSLALLVILSWASISKAFFSFKLAERTQTLEIPYGPLKIVIFIGFVLLGLVLLAETVKFIVGLPQKSEKG